MDLVSSIRKEGSRGGQTEFKWSDVKDSNRRENYLGHSLMAPVGRWQQGRDLSWYAKGEEDPDAAKRAREEEIRKIKEAEQEAIARALGLPVAVASGSANANMTPLGGKEVERAILEGAADDKGVDRVKGVGFGGFRGKTPAGDDVEKLESLGDVSGDYARAKRPSAEVRTRNDPRSDRRREHRRMDGRERPVEHRSRRDEHRSDRHDRRRHRSRSQDRETTRRRRSVSRSWSRDRVSREHWSHRRRSRSPHASRRSRDDRRQDRYDRKR